MGPREVAERHYMMLEENNKEEWIKTLCLSLRKVVNVRGSSPYFWWETGRRYVDKHGYRYRFHHEENTRDPKHKKYFFSRLKSDGTPTGLPVPIHVVVDEDGEWRVYQASY